MGNKCLGQAVRPNDPQRKSDTETRVDPKTSPVPRLEGNPPAVRRAFLFYGRKARRAVGFLNELDNHKPSIHPRAKLRPARRSRDCEGAIFHNPAAKLRPRAKPRSDLLTAAQHRQNVLTQCNQRRTS